MFIFLHFSVKQKSSYSSNLASGKAKVVGHIKYHMCLSGSPNQTSGCLR